MEPMFWLYTLIKIVITCNLLVALIFSTSGKGPIVTERLSPYSSFDNACSVSTACDKLIGSWYMEGLDIEGIRND